MDLEELRQIEASGDPITTEQARLTYLQSHPTGLDATAVRYRLGLARLLIFRDRENAMHHFKLAANDKHGPDAAEARISLALCLAGQKKQTQAIFELRKLLPQGAAPTPHTANALDFLALLLQETQAPPADVAKTNLERQQHLTALAGAVKTPQERAHYLLRLAAVLAESSSPTERSMAKQRLNDVIALGASAGDANIMAAQTMLKQLPR